MHSPDSQWSRLAPIALLYFTVAALRNTLNSNNLIMLLPLLLIGWRTILENPQLWLPTIALFLGLMAFIGWLQFMYYKFRISSGRVEVRSGVVSRKHVDLPHERIQNVRFVQPVYYRPTDHLCVELDTAGSSGKEARLVALPREQAEALKRQVLARASAASADAAETSANAREPSAGGEPTAAAEIELKTRSLGDLIIYGISSNRIWVMLALLGALSGQLSNRLVDYAGQLGFDPACYFENEASDVNEALDSGDTSATHQPPNCAGIDAAAGLGMLLGGALLFGLLFVLLLFLALLSVLGSIISFHDYRLSRAGDRYIRRGGLFTRHEVSMGRRRLQGLMLGSNWLNQVFGRANLRFEQFERIANYSSKPDEAMTHRDSFLVPALRPEEAKELINDAIPGSRMTEIEYLPINPRYILQCCAHWGAFLGPLALLCYLIGDAVNSSLLTGLVPYILLLTVFACLMMVQVWRRHGYACDQNFLYVRTGCIGVKYRCVPVHKIQAVQIWQSYLQRRRGLCDLTLQRVGLPMQMPFIPHSHAKAIADWVLYRIEAEKQPWM